MEKYPREDPEKRFMSQVCLSLVTDFGCTENRANRLLEKTEGTKLTHLDDPKLVANGILEEYWFRTLPY